VRYERRERRKAKVTWNLEHGTWNMSAHLKRLEKENRLSKELLAEKKLESKIKDELLKKSLHSGIKKRNSVSLCW
jgi:hypothetical protein